MAGDGPDDGLYTDPNLSQFYDCENRWGPDFDFCTDMASDAGSILDLGCGTGELLARLAAGRVAVGVDPAAAMLAVAKQRLGGDRATWMQADARELRLDHRFDLIVLTGHAFQVFLTERDQRAVLATITAHLAPDGHFVFDTRNPALQTWRGWTPEHTKRSFAHPELGHVEAWTDTDYDEATGVATYQSNYRVVASGEHFTAASKIRFTPMETLAELLHGAGLAVETWHGDWQGGACTSASADLIPVGRLA